MLLELRVENYAVIDNLVVEFAPGLNLLTGETGAGKSILIDALALLLGEKASTDVIRYGAEKAVISGVFQVENPHPSAAPQGGAPETGTPVRGILDENGIELDGNELILRREIAAGGKGRVFINNQPATVGVLRQLAPLLASIHAQKESMFAFAFDASARLVLLDSFANADAQPVAEVFARWSGIRERIAELERTEQERLRLVDLWRFQKKEIEDAHLLAGEDLQLDSEKRVLANAEKIYSAAMSAYDQLYDNSASAAALLRAAARQVEELSRFDLKFKDMLVELENARIAVQDAADALRNYADGIDASPERLAQVEDRLALIERLKRKYGQSLDDVIAYGADVSRKLDEVENKDEVLKQLRAELATAAAEYLCQTRALSRQRYQAAARLERLVESEINDLAMKARFKIELTGTDEERSWTPAGFDRVAYLISANPGEPLGPVEQIASGGELSRVMLALKVSVARPLTAGQGSRKAGVAQPPPAGQGPCKAAGEGAHTTRTMVFDEIDTGIGGRAAEAVGRKLKALAQTTQVLCVTHLPQIASFADHHYVIEKKEVAGRTRTSIRPLDGNERTVEIARMLSGAKITDASLKNAAQMLKANA